MAAPESRTTSTLRRFGAHTRKCVPCAWTSAPIGNRLFMEAVSRLFALFVSIRELPQERGAPRHELVRIARRYHRPLRAVRESRIEQHLPCRAVATRHVELDRFMVRIEEHHIRFVQDRLPHSVHVV